MSRRNTFFSFTITAIILFLPVNAFSQANSNPLSDEFLAGLPPSVAEELTLNNAVKKEEDLEKLFRADTEFIKSKDILEKIRYELKSIEKRIDKAEGREKGLQRFGETFFSTIQSSFMPVNVPSSSTTYVVDVGDEFSIMLTGTTKVIGDSVQKQMIQRDGTILIPDIGKLYIAGMTLASAEQAIKNYLEKTSPGVSSFISLSKVRDINILMLGGVVSPGIFTLGGGSNILTALNVAGGISDKGSYRKIEHKRNGKVIQTVDLYEIFINGNINLNNDLRSGDALLVHPMRNSIPVSGGVNYEAIFESLPGETAADLINFAGNFSSGFDGHDRIFVKRSNLNGNEIIDVPIDELSKFKVNPRDTLLVPSFSNILEPAKHVIIEGKVNSPGKYFISDNESLSSLIKRAGGYKENAYEFGGAIFRETASNSEKQFAQLTYFNTVNFVISNLAQPGMKVNGEVGKLLAEELRSRVTAGRVVTEFNLAKLANNPNLDIVLEHNDKIVIPSLQKVVYLFGDFRLPANLTYDPNLSINDYIDMAGGINDSADKELIVIDPSGVSHVYKKSFLSKRDVELYPGSIIYASRDITKIDGVRYAATVSPILSSLAISLASLNSISN
jgi:protein involved in polysaccharide export with SLBB domain